MSTPSFPPTIIIIGAGIFGLSTALAIAKRHPQTQITIIDRLTPPVEDGSSVDTTRCIRADYADPIYAALAARAQEAIKQDAGLAPYYFEQGMSFIYDGSRDGSFYDIWRRSFENAKRGLRYGEVVELCSAEEVFARIHGDTSGMAPLADGVRKWCRGYCNTEDGFIDAREAIRVYYERCVACPAITFLCGTPVARLLFSPSEKEAEGPVVQGVVLQDHRVLHASTVLVAAGAWSGQLVDLRDRTYATAIEVAWLKVTAAEEAKWKEMSITTNLSTGFNLFPPHRGEIKILRRSAGYRNTVTIDHPHPNASLNASSSNAAVEKQIVVSLPRTSVTHPGDVIPLAAELALREDLKEIMPSLAQRPFDRTKLCWLAQSPTADFLVCPHPELANVHVATAGSAHAWKFLPIIGDLVVDSMMGCLDEVLQRKWAWGTQGGDGGNAPRMVGEAQELRDVVRKL